MRKFFLLLSLALVSYFSLTASNSYADCQGCCSWHDGVCCIDGITMCCDGTYLSDTCLEKGCDVCPEADSGCFVDSINDKLYDVYSFEYSPTEE